ncbi:MAG TPA: AraC family transcriptional regulator [Burkholderiales bacterium]|nr:AraC family transcriptional regulator [Burkholderiales bacterium]
MEKIQIKPKIAHWQAEGCNLLRFDIAPNQPIEINKIFHDEIMMIAFVGSTWSSYQNGRRYTETPDCMVLRDAGQIFSVKTDSIDERHGSICREIRISPERLRELYEACDNKLPVMDFRNPVIQSPRLHRHLLKTHATFELSDCSLEKSTQLALFIGAVAEETSCRQMPVHVEKRRGNRYASIVIDYLRENYSQNITLKDLAALTNTNPFVLLRQFRNEVGVTPHEYLLSHRINCASRYIQRGIALANVALLCGFSDQSHLTRKFRRMVGITPGQFLPLQQK